MPLRFVLDENFRGPLWNACRRSAASVDVVCVGEAGGPPLSIQDPDLLAWAENENRILVTQDKSTMPGHLAAHLASGRHCPGILTFTEPTRIRAIIAYISLAAEAGLTSDFQDQIVYPTV